MGGEVPWQQGIRMIVTCPRRALIIVRKDGRLYAKFLGFSCLHELREPGVYRVEVFLTGKLGKRRAWIFSNPVYVRPS